MLADAIRAEANRLSRNRTALFWSLLFAPLLTLALGTLTQVVLKANEAKVMAESELPPEVQAMLAGGALNMGEALVANAGGLANPLVLLFVLIGAATIYAGDYRWETWRMISARNSRTNLLLGKLATIAGLILAAMLLMLIAGLIGDLIRAAIFSRALAFSMTGEMVGQFLGLLGLAWLRIIQFTMLGMLAAVVSRSLLAALFVPMFVGAAQTFSPQMLMQMGVMPDAWLAVLVNPGAAYDAIASALRDAPAAAPRAADIALKACLSLLLWTAVPLAGAIAWFNRQDLSKE